MRSASPLQQHPVVRLVSVVADPRRGVPAGDFAVLLKAGMTVKQAIVYNLLSAMMAYIGMLIGTAVGQYANNITLWIFAVTAGMFLYVALVDMVWLPGAVGPSGRETWGCCISVWCSGLFFTKISLCYIQFGKA